LRIGGTVLTIFLIVSEAVAVKTTIRQLSSFAKIIAPGLDTVGFIEENNVEAML
jgi:hypothetical protein